MRDGKAKESRFWGKEKKKVSKCLHEQHQGKHDMAEDLKAK